MLMPITPMQLALAVSTKVSGVPSGSGVAYSGAFAPSISNASPLNGALNVYTNPTLSISASDLDGDLMTVVFETNATGTWENIRIYSNVGNGKYTCIPTTMNQLGTRYFWRISVSDGSNWVTGNYTFTTTTTILSPKWTATETPYASTGVLIADVVGDSKEEIIMVGAGMAMVLNGTTGAVIWSKSLGSGVTEAVTPEIADLNKDGIKEIVIQIDHPPGLLVLHANDGSTYWSITNLGGGDHSGSPVIADIDGNGYPTIFCTTATEHIGLNSTSQLYSISYDGHILHQTFAWHTCAGGLSVGDTDNDGVFELYVGDRNQGYGGDEGIPRGLRSFWASNLTVRWEHPEILCSSNRPMLADVNKDGILDVIIGHHYGGIGVFNSKDGSVIREDLGLGRDNAPVHYQPSVYDIDEDGNLEMLMQDEEHTSAQPVVWDLVLWQVDARLPVFPGKYGPQMADVNGDGHMEIIVCNNTDIFVFDKNYTLVAQVQGLLPRLMYAVVQDIDGDGYNEVVVNREGSSGRIYAFDTPARTPIPRPRTEVRYYSERRNGAQEYVPKPGAAPVVSDLLPTNGAINIPTSLSQLSFRLTDFQNNHMNYTVTTFPNIGTLTRLNVVNGIQTVGISGLAYNTVYTWKVNVTDGVDWTNKTFTFTTEKQFTLDVNIVGNGTVKKDPDLALYDFGTEVNLTAIADPDWVFAGWSGDLSGTNNPATITIDGNKTVTATFTFGPNAPPVVSNPQPSDSATGVPVSTSLLNFTVNDADGDIMDYYVSTAPNVGSRSQTGVSDGTYSVSVSGLAYGTAYTWWVNATDGTDWTNATFTFTTEQLLLVDSEFNDSVDSAALRANDAGQDWYESRNDLPTLLYLDTSNVGGDTSKKAGFTADSTKNAYLTQEFSSAQTGTFTVQWDIYVDSILDIAIDRAGFMLIGRSGTGGPNRADADRFVYLAFYKNGGGTSGTMDLVAMSNFNTYTTVASGLNMKQWYTIRVAVNVTAGTYDVYVDGVFTATENRAAALTSLTHISFAQWNDGAGAFYVDNVFSPAKDRYKLTTSTSGNGAVQRNPGEATYIPSTIVTLTAVPAEGWIFSGWTGDVSGIVNPINVTMNGNKAVTATFTQTGYTLTVNVVGGGHVTKVPDQASYQGGTEVTLNATADPACTFLGWSGDLSGSEPSKTLVMNSNKIVTATFTTVSYDDVIFDSSFDMGNLRNVLFQSGDASGNRFYTGEQNHTTVSFSDKHWWFYFSMDNVAGKTVTIKLVNNEAADFSGNRWNEIEPVFSYDNTNWERVPLSGVTYDSVARTFTMTVSVQAGKSKIWLAPLPPYNIARRDALFAEFASSPYLTVTSLGTTPGGQQLKVATITDPAYSDAGKFKSYVIGQQHAGEVPGSWNAEGLIRFLLSNDPTAIAIRRSYIFKIVPIVNVDGVFQGVSRYTPLRNGDPYDLNRDWTSRTQPEIQWIWNDLLSFQPDSFNDMHSTINTEVGSPKELLTYTWSTSDPEIIAFRASIRNGGFPETVTGTSPYACTVVHEGLGIDESVSWENPFDELSTNPGVKLTVSDWMTWGAAWAKGNYLYFGDAQGVLTTNVVGSGSINKNPNQTSYAYGTSVQLTAVPTSGWYFSGWSGDASGSVSPVTVNITGNKSVTATFTENPVIKYILTVNTVGNGSVQLDKAGPYDPDTVVQLTAVPGAGWTFSGWSGDASGSVSPTTVTMTGNKTVTATFTSNLKLYLPFTTNASDISGYDNNGVTNGGVTHTTNYGGAYIFDGTTGFINVADNPDASLDGNGTWDKLTIELWVRPDSANPTAQRILRKGGSSAPFSYQVGFQTSNGRLYFDVWNPTTMYEVEYTTLLNANTWYHIVCVYQSDIGSKIYVNGVDVNAVKVGTGSESGYTAASRGVNLYIGCRYGTQNWFDGYIDDVQIYSEALSSSVAQQHYDATKTVHSDYALTVNTVGNGTVTKNPSQATYAYGTNVELTAVADTSWSFGGWSGDLVGYANPTTIIMNGNKTVTATFSLSNPNLVIYSVVIKDQGCKIYANDTYANGTNYSVPVEVTVFNSGSSTAGQFNVSLQVYWTTGSQQESIFQQTVASLDAGKNVSLTFNFRPTHTRYYNLTATADCNNAIVESNETDNSLSRPDIPVTTKGDINGDGIVNILDAVIIGLAWGSTPTDLYWNIRADINHDNIVNLLDGVQVGLHWGQTW